MEYKSKETLEYEKKLTPENLQNIYRYMTQGIEGLQVAGAFYNLATKRHPNMPLSNSILLHELKEAEEMKKSGHDFYFPEIDNLSDEEKEKLFDFKQKYLMKNLHFHVTALKEQYLYLSSIAKDRGYDLSFGTILYMTPLFSKNEYDLAVEYDFSFQFIKDQVDSAARFSLGLLKNEAAYAELFNSCSKRKNYTFLLYDKYPLDIKHIIEVYKSLND